MKKSVSPIVVAVSGGFDPVHIGHVRLFNKAKKLGDVLVVILNNDNWLHKKIVDIDQKGIFNHTISELRLEKIEDVTSQTKGALGTIFDFGNVFVQTAGAMERFEFENVPNPAYVSKMILDLYAQLPKGVEGEK